MKSLVVYFSVTNNTKVVAKEIARQMGADICEIKPIESYRKDYESLMTRGINEVKKGIRPQIHNVDIDMACYDMIFLGSPNWLDTYASPLSTFMEEYNLEGKIIVPFVTYDQSDKGHMDKDIRKVYSNCRVIDAIGIERDGGSTLSKEIEIAIARKNLHNLNMPVKH